jgi:hypothetical protein
MRKKRRGKAKLITLLLVISFAGLFSLFHLRNQDLGKPMPVLKAEGVIIVPVFHLVKQ